MRRGLKVSRTSRLLGLLICLLGVASVVVSYFVFPLYVNLDGSGEFSGWEWVSTQINNMLIHGVTPTFIFGIGWTLLPLIAAALVGILGIARAIFALRSLGLLYLIICLLGSIVLGFTLFLVVYGLRIGALGEAVGYALCFAADRVWRSARRSHAAMA
jgi:hypothetical protein